VELAGGRYADVDFYDAVIDGNLITGPAWTAHPAVLRNFLHILEAWLPEK